MGNTVTTVKEAHRGRTREILTRIVQNKGALAGGIVIVILILVSLFAGFFLDYDTQVIGQNVAERLQGPSLRHWFGTDEVGRDIFSRIMYGTRYSLSVGVAAVVIGLVIGVTLGAFAGYFGGAAENIIMRCVDILGAIPGILLAIVIVSVLGQSIFNLMLAIGITSVPQFVRITRAAVLTVKNEEYVEAAKTIGLSHRKIIFRHILPNCLSPIIVQTTLRMASAIISASGLSFLGLGVPAPQPEWGALLSAGRKYIREYSYMTVFPGLAIMITVLSLNLVGDGLRDALDPKLKQ
ncbi:ABC transporter permease [Lacrimispora sp.]|uniref:ABC transporter permease n=1 Tax=Lacrimispora sp. TaxID=2719234 RepID=UPI00289ACAEE|nr:ABC transporter permease [Lacrimispora sp.]